MKAKYQKYMDYVEKTLIDAKHDIGRIHPFRSRVQHIKRVVRYVDDLICDIEKYNEDILYISAIFHDIGYAFGHENHQTNSEKLFREYARDNGIPKEITEAVAHIIGTHSDKELMANPDKISVEHILVMEADLLDEEGALAICWGSMASGYEGDKSYDECMQRINDKLQKRLKKPNPMITDKAKKMWDEKQYYVKEYIEKLKSDLKIYEVT